MRQVTHHRFAYFRGLYEEILTKHFQRPDALLSMDCELVGSIDAADHILFLGGIIEAVKIR